jgi:branched-chain amino acid transport system ATP-binding protein
MLRAEHITVAYGAHRALEDVSVRVEPGEVCVILGANGAGKSTLLKAIAGLVHAQPGARIRVGDDDLTGVAPYRIVERGIALVPEGRGIFGDLTVGENLALGAYGRQARADRDERLTEVLSLFPRLAERKGQVVRTMSGGEQQMVAIGRALMSNPRILMLDEPSLGLSPLLASELFRSLAQIQDSGVGILLVEQNARLSLAIADRAYLLENGHIVGEGRASALASDPAVQRAYLGGAASDTHRRFGDTDTVAPLASLAAGGTAADLADRATRIQRSYVEARRNGPSHVDGSAVQIVDHPVPAEPIVMSKQASELSQTAADLARRAAEISAAHLARTRNGKVSAVESPPSSAPTASPATRDVGQFAAELAARASGILTAHIAEKRAVARDVEAIMGASPPAKKSKKDKPAKGSKKLKKQKRFAREF